MILPSRLIEFAESGDYWIQGIDAEGNPVGDPLCDSTDLPSEVVDLICAMPGTIDLLDHAIALIRATIDGGYVAAIVPQMRALIAAYDAQKGAKR